MKNTGFENYAEALRPYIEGFREERRKADAEKKNKAKASPSKTDDRGTSSADEDDP